MKVSTLKLGDLFQTTSNYSLCNELGDYAGMLQPNTTLMFLALHSNTQQAFPWKLEALTDAGVKVFMFAVKETPFLQKL